MVPRIIWVRVAGEAGAVCAIQRCLMHMADRLARRFMVPDVTFSRVLASIHPAAGVDHRPRARDQELSWTC
jgi:hypothetical protein